ncbi:MAG TPA: hypothetical protein PKE64_13440 [Anaerolineae bacterium]|nr:hypothetical protein [Anaerolineae bacterium]
MSDPDKKKPSKKSDIESPVDGPTPDWMKAATSSDTGSSLSDENMPSWLKEIKSGKTLANASPNPEPVDDPTDSMSDLERLLAEEGIDLSAVAEERPEGAEGMSARDWIISTSDDDLIRKRIGADAMAEVLDEAHSTFDLAAETPDPTDLGREMSDLERLLAEEGIDLSAVAEERPEGAEGISARDWIISTSDDDLIRKRIGSDTPAELFEPKATPPSSSRFRETHEEDDKMIITDDLPDWLQESEEFDDTTDYSDFDEAASIDQSDLPDWLREVEEPSTAAVEPATSAETQDVVEQDDLPDWLRDETEERTGLTVGAEAPSAVTPTTAEDEDDKMVVSDDLPDWLRESNEDLDALPLEDSFDEIVVEDELPDWLREAAEAEVVTERETVVEEENLPDWLTEVEETADSTPPNPTDDLSLDLGEAEAEDEEDDLPAWFRETRQEAALENALPEGKPVAMDTPDLDDDDLPDWLRDSAEEEAEPLLEMAPATGDLEDDDSDLPDWLRDIEETGEELFGETTAVVEGTGRDLPDWLSDASLAAAPDDVFEPSEPTPEEPTIEIKEELPDWLKAANEEGFADLLEVDDLTMPAPEPGTAELEEDELPDWLRVAAEATAEADEAEAEPEPEPKPEPKVEVVTQPEPEPKPVVEPPARRPDKPGALPDWLRKLRQGEPASPPPLRAATAVPVSLPTPHYAAIQVAPVAQSARPDVLAAPDNLPPDAVARLELARTARKNGNLEEALAIYNSLVHSGTQLGAVINDIQDSLKTYPSSYLLFQIMGDAMVKDGRLQNALEAYRQALARLPS